MKKSFLGKHRAQVVSNKPKDYDLVFKNSQLINEEEFVASRENWMKKQKEEIKRARQEKPQLFKL